MLGGKDNYEADRAAAARVLELEPETPLVARENRDFLCRTVRFLAAEAAIRQFLDIGTGMPTMGNVREVAQQVAPESRIAYVDNDAVVLNHARALLASSPEGKCGYIDSDLRDVEGVITEAARMLDFSQPASRGNPACSPAFHPG
jgi:hypothetical protein